MVTWSVERSIASPQLHDRGCFRSDRAFAGRFRRSRPAGGRRLHLLWISDHYPRTGDDGCDRPVIGRDGADKRQVRGQESSFSARVPYGQVPPKTVD